MHAVARAVDVAAEQALVRLHQVEMRVRDRAADRAREAPVAPQAADVERIDDVRLEQLQLGLRPFARVERDGDVALEQRLQRAFDEALGAAEGRVALADDRDAHPARS